MTLILAITVWRSRRLARRQVLAESQRSNLSRYFSPNIVDELAGETGGVDRVASQNVAILFADMVGFTTLSENMTAEAGSTIEVRWLGTPGQLRIIRFPEKFAIAVLAGNARGNYRRD